MRQFIFKFRADEDGAVTTDWVALTAAIVLLAATVAVTVRDGAIDGGNDIGNQVAGMVTP